MALITDPDNLSQGTSTAVSDAVWGTPTGQTVTITSALSELPSLGAGDFFEVRDHSNSANNGLYVETGGTPGSGSITADKLTGSSPVAAGSEAIAVLGKDTTAADEKSVMIDTQGYQLLVLEQGLVVGADGVHWQALYSFLKEEWKSDTTLPPYEFPITAIDSDAGKYELTDDWTLTDISGASVRTTKVLRNGGAAEVDADGVTQKVYAGIITLGSFEDEAADYAYYQFGDDPTDTSAAVAFEFPGPVNEMVLCYAQNVGPGGASGINFVDGGGGNDQIYDVDGGNFATAGYVIGGQVTVEAATTGANNGTYTILDIVTTTSTNDTLEVATASLTADTGDTTARLAADNRNSIRLKLRIRDADTYGKSFDQADLTSAGKTSLNNYVFSFPLANATDVKIAETDANIAANSPYTQILSRYFDQAFTIDVDTPGAGRNFGIVVDVGTMSGVDGVTAGGSALTSAEGGIPSSTYDGGTLIVHEGTDKGSWTITTASGTTVNISGSFAGSESNLSFTLQRATPIVATAEEIFEKVQYLLRQASDIDSTDQTVVGKTAGELLKFEGDDLKTGTKTPSNPNGGGSGVKIMGFSANDTNRLYFTDNGGTVRQYPFVAAGTISWNTYLELDANGYYWMFFTYTERFTNTGFGLSAPSGDTATLDSSVTDLTTELASGDYIRLGGFTDGDLDGLYVLTGAPAGTGPWTAPVRRVDGTTLAAEAAGASVSLDKNPVGSPDAIIVQNNSSADIKGSTFGGSSTTFDFDYDNNVQGGRTAGTNAAITLRAIGYDSAQWVETTGVISRAVGLSYTLVAAQERNYDNP